MKEVFRIKADQLLFHFFSIVYMEKTVQIIGTEKKKLSVSPRR